MDDDMVELQLALQGRLWEALERVRVDYASHTISPSAVEERCVCGAPATHKVGDQSGPRNFHELTSYMCCKCMEGVGMNCKYYPPY